MASILKKIIIYNYLYNNENYLNKNFLKYTVSSILSITRQNPLFILNKKSEIIALKTTLINKKLINFLYKLKNFTLLNSNNISLFSSNFYKFDTNYNFNIYIKNQSYFFEYILDKLLPFYYDFKIQFVFNKNLGKKYKINYILKNLKLKFQ